MTPEEKDEKLKELEDKLDDIAQKVEDADNEGNDELVKVSEEYIEVTTTSPVKKQVVHFISIDETQSFDGDCSNIEDSKDAEKAFREASEYRQGGDKKPFEHGNILVLECQGEKQSASESEPSSSSDPVPDGCYYIGICSVMQNLYQEADPFSLLESQEDGGDTVKNFMAWSTCGGGGDNFAFEKPETIYSALCKDDENTVGIKLLFEDENETGEELSQNAFIPLLPSNVSCPENGDFTYLRGVTITKENYPTGTAKYRLKIVKEFRKMTFAGGILVNEDAPESSLPGDDQQPQYIDIGTQYANEELIEICRDGSPYQIYVPYRDVSGS